MPASRKLPPRRSPGALVLVAPRLRTGESAIRIFQSRSVEPRAVPLSAGRKLRPGFELGKRSHKSRRWKPHTVSESAGVAPPGELARIVASLLPAGVRGEVFDPACGEGRLLQAVADRFGDRVKLSGEESDDAAAAVAALAFRSRIDGTHAEIRIGDSIRGGAASQCAAVVCDVQASRLASRYGEIAWVQHCLAQLRSGAVAVLVVSARTCIQKSGEAIRTELIRSGALRHVIALPTTASVGSCIWILRQPAEATDAAPVRVIDLTALADIADVPQDFAAWKIVDEALVRAVPRQELLANGSSVLPSDYVRPVHFPAGDIDGFVSRVKDLHEKAAVAFPRFAAGARPDGPNVDIAELERAGALLIRSRDTTPRKGDVLIRTLGRPPVVATGGEREQAGVAHVIETDPSRLDPYFVAIFLRTEAAALPVGNPLGVLNRDDLRRCRIPRIELADQPAYGDAFRTLSDLQGFIDGLASVSTKVIDQMIHGLTTGALEPAIKTDQQSEARQQ